MHFERQVMDSRLQQAVIEYSSTGSMVIQYRGCTSGRQSGHPCRPSHRAPPLAPSIPSGIRSVFRPYDDSRLGIFPRPEIYPLLERPLLFASTPSSNFEKDGSQLKRDFWRMTNPSLESKQSADVVSDDIDSYDYYGVRLKVAYDSSMKGIDQMCSFPWTLGSD